MQGGVSTLPLVFFGASSQHALTFIACLLFFGYILPFRPLLLRVHTISFPIFICLFKKLHYGTINARVVQY